MTVRQVGFVVSLCSMLAGQAEATVQEQLDTAADNRTLAFILVMEPGIAGLDAASDAVQGAMDRVANSTLVQLDRSDPANAPLVQRHRLANAPMPLILLAAPNGAIAGGMPGVNATPEALIRLVPTPKKAEALQAIQSGRSVFIVASRNSMASPEASRVCALACQQMNDKAVTIEIDLDDTSEAPFLAQLQIGADVTEPVTKVINPQGQVTGSFVGSVELARLVQDATKRASGCCPPNSGKTCGPTKKK